MPPVFCLPVERVLATRGGRFRFRLKLGEAGTANKRLHRSELLGLRRCRYATHDLVTGAGRPPSSLGVRFKSQQQLLNFVS